MKARKVRLPDDMKVLADPKVRVVNGRAESGRYSIAVASDEEAAAAPMIICLQFTGSLRSPDNERGLCFLCGHPIQFRPTVPKKPPKVCIPCAFEWASAVEH